MTTVPVYVRRQTEHSRHGRRRKRTQDAAFCPPRVRRTPARRTPHTLGSEADPAMPIRHGLWKRCARSP